MIDTAFWNSISGAHPFFSRNRLFAASKLAAILVATSWLAVHSPAATAAGGCPAGKAPDAQGNCVTTLDTIVVIGVPTGGGGAPGAGGGGPREDMTDSQGPIEDTHDNAGQVENNQRSGSTRDPCKRSNPILLSTGNKVESEQDFAGTGQFPLWLERTYSHYWRGVGLFGRQWVSNFDYKLTFGTTEVNACYPRPGGGACGIGANTVIWAWRPDGRTIRFTQATDGIFYEERATPIARIVPQSDGSFVHYTEGGATEHYSSAGYVSTVTDPHGISWSFTYSGTYLQRVTHTSGRYVDFIWSGSQLTSVRDPAGNYYGFAYSANTFGAGLHRLSATSKPGLPATSITYHYELAADPTALTGKSMSGSRYSTFGYDANGYANRSEHNGMSKFLFTYVVGANGAMTVTETNPLGKTATYQFQDGRIVSVTGNATASCLATYAETVYDANGYPQLSSDADGRDTYTEYNGAGQLLVKIEGYGSPQARRFEYTWDPTTRKMASVTLVGYSRTSYTYTADRRIASATVTNLTGFGVPNQSRTTNYSYTKHGNGMLATVTVDGSYPGPASLSWTSGCHN